MRAELLVHGVGLRRFMTGEALTESFTKYTQLLESL